MSSWMNYFTFSEKIVKKIVEIHSLCLQLLFRLEILVTGVLIVL